MRHQTWGIRHEASDMRHQAQFYQQQAVFCFIFLELHHSHWVRQLGIPHPIFFNRFFTIFLWIEDINSVFFLFCHLVTRILLTRNIHQVSFTAAPITVIIRPDPATPVRLQSDRITTPIATSSRFLATNFQTRALWTGRLRGSLQRWRRRQQTQTQSFHTRVIVIRATIVLEKFTLFWGCELAFFQKISKLGKFSWFFSQFRKLYSYCWQDSSQKHPPSVKHSVSFPTQHAGALRSRFLAEHK